MDREELLERYRAYIDCLNRRDWSRLGDLVSDEAQYNGETIGLSGYLKMLERDVAAIPDPVFNIDFLVADPPVVGEYVRLQTQAVNYSTAPSGGAMFGHRSAIVAHAAAICLKRLTEFEGAG